MIADRRSQIADRTMFDLAGFHMIADRRSQIADRNKVCDLRSAIIWKPALSRLLQNNNGKCSNSVHFGELEPQWIIFRYLFLEPNAVEYI